MSTCLLLISNDNDTEQKQKNDKNNARHHQKKIAYTLQFMVQISGNGIPILYAWISSCSTQSMQLKHRKSMVREFQFNLSIGTRKMWHCRSGNQNWYRSFLCVYYVYLLVQPFFLTLILHFVLFSSLFSAFSVFLCACVSDSSSIRLIVFHLISFDLHQCCCTFQSSHGFASLQANHKHLHSHHSIQLNIEYYQHRCRCMLIF